MPPSESRSSASGCFSGVFPRVSFPVEVRRRAPLQEESLMRVFQPTVAAANLAGAATRVVERRSPADISEVNVGAVVQ